MYLTIGMAMQLFLRYSTVAHIVTSPSISITGMREILDQCSFVLYLSSNKG